MGDKANAPLVSHPVDVELRRDIQFVLVGKDPGQVAADQGLVDPEGNVMIVARGDLDADDQVNAVVGALVAVILGLEPVVVGEHDKVDAVGAGRLDDLPDRRTPVMGIVGVEVNDPGVVIELQDERAAVFLKPRPQDFFPDEHCSLSAAARLSWPGIRFLPDVPPSGHWPHSGSFRQNLFPVSTMRAWY